MNSGTSGRHTSSTAALCQSASPIRTSTTGGTITAATSAGTARVR